MIIWHLFKNLTTYLIIRNESVRYKLQPSGNFEAYSDKLSFDKDDKSLKLIGNVYVKNLVSEVISIEETSGDELTIFTDTGIFEFKSQNKNRVTTKIKF